MDTPKISIITVCFNAEHTIEETIRSVIDQSYTHIEYLIIDGQSQDNTLSIINKFSSRISKIISEPDTGIYNAMNKGINLATGNYLLFLNADDHLLSHTVIENYINRIKQNDDNDIYYGDVLVYDQTIGRGKVWEAKKVSGKVLYNSTLPHPSTLYSKSVFEELGGYDESYKISADHEFFLRAFIKGKKFKYINILAAFFATGGISTSGKYNAQQKEERQRAIDTHFSKFDKFFLRFRVRFKKLFNI